jgi:hypothetical protein
MANKKNDTKKFYKHVQNLTEDHPHYYKYAKMKQETY